jgi:hypothetical protein
MPKLVRDSDRGKYKIVPDRYNIDCWNIVIKSVFIFDKYMTIPNGNYLEPASFLSVDDAKAAIDRILLDKRKLKEWRKQKEINYP